MTSPIVVAFGDSGVLIQLPGAAGVETSRVVLGLARRIEAATAALPGWGRPSPQPHRSWSRSMP